MLRKIINRHWNVLQINPGCKEQFRTIQLWHLKETKTQKKLQEIKNGKVFKARSKNRKGKYEPCNTSKPSLCCRQAIDTSTFRSYHTQQLYTIFHKLSCKSKFIIYLMECALCKVQYIGKAETTFNIKLNYFYSNYIHKMPGNTDFYLLTIF